MKTGSKPTRRSSVRRRWWGVTSAVTRIPRFLAHRTTSTDPAVERWQMWRGAPTCSASKTSRAMMDSSATPGHPTRPSWADRAPSFICASTVRRGSWACCAMTAPTVRAYSRARRISWESETHFPSSEKTRTWALPAAMPPIAESSSPAKPLVTAPTGRTSTYPASWPSRCTASVTALLSATGSVFAMA